MHEGLCFWICCSHPCFNRNSNSKDLFGMDPKVLAIKFFHNFFFKRERFWKSVFFCSPFLMTQSKAEIKLHKHNKGVFRQHTHCDPWKVIGTSFACRAFLFLCWSYVCCSVCFFSFLQKVSGHQILEWCIKDIVFGFVVHIHALTEIQIQKF